MSHVRRLFDCLKRGGMEYRTFMHSWRTDKNRIWGEESPVPIDYTEYALLSPDVYQLDEQDMFLDTIRFADYFDRSVYNVYGGDTYREWRPELIRNHLCALESQRRVTEMMMLDAKSSGCEFDYVVYVRPDVEIHTDFDVSWLSGGGGGGGIGVGEIAIPNREHYEGYNDRFAIVPYANSGVYGKRIEEIVEFRKERGRIVSEKFVKYIVEKYFTRVHFVDFVFTIERP